MAGAQAANALGLSTQVPARRVYLTDGNSRRVVHGKHGANSMSFTGSPANR
jgi:hypothetical protein